MKGRRLRVVGFFPGRLCPNTGVILAGEYPAVFLTSKDHQLIIRDLETQQ